MKLIFIHGPIASGKLTIARKLCARTGFKLFHNHLVVDAVGAVFDFGSEPFVRLREEFWLSVFADAAKEDRSLVFTFAPERTVSPAFVSKTVDAVTKHDGEVCFVTLTLPREEQLRRIEDEERRSFGKLTSAKFFERLESEGAFTFPQLPDNGLVLDTAALSPDAAVQRICGFFGLA